LEVERFKIYGRELGETGALLVSLLVVSGLASRPRAFAVTLLMVTLADALILARHRPFDFGPARSLTEQSPVLARLAREPRGTRTLDPVRNLSMLSGVDALWAYRTLDLPSPNGLLQLTWGRVAGLDANEPMRITGADVRVLDSMESRGVSPEALEPWWAKVETFRDPALAGWISGVDYMRLSGLQDFILLRPDQSYSRAWLIPSNGLVEEDGMVNPLVLIEKFQSATPLPSRSDLPERVELAVTVSDPTPSMVVLSTSFDPEWQAWWVGPTGIRQPAEVVKVLGGWQGVKVPEPGRWTLHLEYPGRAVWQGLGVSSCAWIIWVLGFIGVRTRVVDIKPEDES